MAGRRVRRWWLAAALPWVGILAVAGTWMVGVGGAAPAERTPQRAVRVARLASPMVQSLARPTATIPVLWVLTPAGPNGLTIYSAPDGAPSAALPAQDELGSPLVLLATARHGDWFQALLPSRPNGATGWIRATDVVASAPTYRVEVSRAAHQLKVIRLTDGAVVLTSVVGVGSASTPTPAGEFFIRDLFPTGTMNHPYGPFAFGLSGHSDVLMHFGTGDGRIAIHGTNQPGSIGADQSNGCVHVPNDFDLTLIPLLSLGTPVVIS
ncbi:MAG TPA: L,D-transpeptidase [Acidimicrobiia bacterium]|nr:L,D-transpeptidase [Acidimicrobiia bacterium]